MKSRNPRSFAALAFALAAACALAAPALAQDTTDEECVTACREDLMNCRFDAREASKQCIEDAGCDVLRDTYRNTCFVADRDEEACDAARQALRDCLEPCREALRDDSVACREDLTTCLTDECGLEERPFRRHRHGRRGGSFRR